MSSPFSKTLEHLQEELAWNEHCIGEAQKTIARLNKDIQALFDEGVILRAKIKKRTGNAPEPS